MKIPDELYCVFTAQVEEQDGSYRLEVPEREITIGDVDAGDTYRVALLGTGSETETASASTETESTHESNTTPSRPATNTTDRRRNGSRPPVAEGETRTVEIKDIGEQGDGVARVENGYVIIVPDTEMRERVTIEVTDVKQNVAFAEVVERQDYYE